MRSAFVIALGLSGCLRAGGGVPPTDSADTDTPVAPLPDTVSHDSDSQMDSDSEPRESDDTDANPHDTDTVADTDTTPTIESSPLTDTAADSVNPADDTDLAATDSLTETSSMSDASDAVDTDISETDTTDTALVQPPDSSGAGAGDSDDETNDSSGVVDTDSDAKDSASGIDTDPCGGERINVYVHVIDPGSTCKYLSLESVCREGWEQYSKIAQCSDLFQVVPRDDGSCWLRLMTCQDTYEFLRDPETSTDCSVHPACCNPVQWFERYVPVCPWDSGAAAP